MNKSSFVGWLIFVMLFLCFFLIVIAVFTHEERKDKNQDYIKSICDNLDSKVYSSKVGWSDTCNILVKRATCVKNGEIVDKSIDYLISEKAIISFNDLQEIYNEDENLTNWEIKGCAIFRNESLPKAKVCHNESIVATFPNDFVPAPCPDALKETPCYDSKGNVIQNLSCLKKNIICFYFRYKPNSGLLTFQNDLNRDIIIWYDYSLYKDKLSPSIIESMPNKIVEVCK